ncbi:hypothetical protein FGU71_13990 [Erythrobacter insulae]|uniref:DUF4398 domain-containing protein n=1 Tax=Erythrobacter insulae TaxID=2584124 RepID=A0A547P7R2_9SPHN|nr:hypothetical protein [Erythrobacter insulae]TRD10094.1 hypothetical protein FGU71_13990 [Erythrobacter insulae]
MQILLRLAAAIAITGIVAAAPVEPVSAQKFKGAGKVKTPKKPQSFKAAKAITKNFKQRGKTAYNNLKATYRSEARNRQVMEQARSNYFNARDNFRANRSQANQNAMNQAYGAYAQRKVQHDNALNAWRSAKTEVRALRDIQNSALNAANPRPSGAASPRPAPRGQPQINPQRRVANQRQGASMVQNPRQIFQQGNRMAVRDPQATLAQPIGNAANFPTAALGNNPPQQLGNINLNQNPYTPVSNSIFRTEGYTLPPPPANAGQQTFDAPRILQNGYEDFRSPL